MFFAESMMYSNLLPDLFKYKDYFNETIMFTISSYLIILNYDEVG